MKIFSFWHNRNEIPAYLQMCFDTWRKFIKNNEIILLDYDNLDNYIDIKQQPYWKLLTCGKYKNALIADVIRVNLLSRYGGLWLDLDTIITSYQFEKQYIGEEQKYENEVFAIDKKYCHLSFIKSKQNSRFIRKLKTLQEEALMQNDRETIDTSFLGNRFTDPYMRSHKSEFNIIDMHPCFPETQIISKNLKAINRRNSYETLYFKKDMQLSDLPPTSILMLHNSWTPEDYRNSTRETVLSKNCTLSNILKELTT